MDEVFPVSLWHRSRSGAPFMPSHLRMPGLAACSVAFGILASWISRELAVSWIYVLIDAAQVLGAGLSTSVLAGRWRYRSWRLP
jgi:hypothetical protein